ncbi:MAG: hypothetical protein QNJ84_10050 [Alphaproteobacteria bacterium]|nr:hypothetical protein [Alphaproteobacteria bacterium]
MTRALVFVIVLMGAAGCLGKFEPIAEDTDPRGLKEGERGLLTGEDGVFKITLPD